MGDKATLAKARMELEEMYSGIPDESVDLTFQDLARLNNRNQNSPQKKKPTTSLMEPISNVTSNTTTTTVFEQESPLQKIPSLDFRKGLQASIDVHHHHQYPLHPINENETVVHPFSTSTTPAHHQYHHNHGHTLSPLGHGYGDHHGHVHQHKMSTNSFIAESGFRHAVEMSSMAHDDAMSGQSMASTYQERGAAGGRRRPGIPHSKICAICSNHIYIFRHRCLVRLTNIYNYMLTF